MTNSPPPELDETLVGDQEPALKVEAAGGVNHDAAAVVLGVADRYQIGLGEAQRISIRTGCAETVDWRWASRTHAVAKCRQGGGKNNEIEAREIAGVTEFGEQLILHTAHEGRTAKEAARRLELTFLNYDDLRKQVDRFLYSNEERGVDLLNGARIRYQSRTSGAGRGFAEADLIVYDEAQHMKQAHLDAVGPAGMANPNSQKWAAGTGGFAFSEYWWRQRRRALEILAGTKPAGNFSYVEHTAQTVHLRPDGFVELTNPENNMDPAAWIAAIPRLGDGLVTVETVMELFEELGPVGFGREILMLWDPEPNTEAPGPIDPRQWAVLAEERDDNDEYPQVVSNERIGFAVSGDEQWSTFAAAGRTRAGHIQVEVADRRPGHNWIIPRGKELSDRYDGIHIRSTGPSAAWIAPLREAGCTVHEVPATEYTRATGRFVAEVNSTDPPVRHLANRYLDAAVKDTRTRAMGDGKLWDIGSTDTDTSPLEAVTLAYGAVPATSDTADPFIVLA